MRQRLITSAKRTAGLITSLAVLGAVAYAILFAAGYRPVVVYSGSMEPALAVGSLAFVQRVPSEEIRVGDVITFTDPDHADRLVTHRVVEEVERPEGGIAYRTKGDANAAVDPWAIALPADAGRLAFDVPFVGYALWYAKTREARTAIIFVIAGLVLVFVLQSIWRSDEDEPETETDDTQAAGSAPPAPENHEVFWVEALTR